MVFQTKTNNFSNFLRNSQEPDIQAEHSPDQSLFDSSAPFNSPAIFQSSTNSFPFRKVSSDRDVGRDDNSASSGSSERVFFLQPFCEASNTKTIFSEKISGEGSNKLNSHSSDESEESSDDSSDEREESSDANKDQPSDQEWNSSDLDDTWQDQFENTSEINLSLSSFQFNEQATASPEEWSDTEDAVATEWNMNDSDEEFDTYIESKPQESLTNKLRHKPLQSAILESESASVASESGSKGDSGCDTPWWFSKEDTIQVSAILSAYTTKFKVNEGSEKRIREPQPFIGIIKRRKVENSSDMFQTFDCVKIFKRSLVAPHSQIAAQKTFHVLTSWSSEEGVPVTFFEIKKKLVKDFWKQRITSELPSYLYALPVSTTDKEYHFFASRQRSKTIMYSPNSPDYLTDPQSSNYLLINNAIEANPHIKASLYPPISEDTQELDFC